MSEERGPRNNVQRKLSLREMAWQECVVPFKFVWAWHMSWTRTSVFSILHPLVNFSWQKITTGWRTCLHQYTCKLWDEPTHASPLQKLYAFVIVCSLPSLSLSLSLADVESSPVESSPGRWRHRPSSNQTSFTWNNLLRRKPRGSQRGSHPNQPSRSPIHTTLSEKRN